MTIAAEITLFNEDIPQTPEGFAEAIGGAVAKIIAVGGTNIGASMTLDYEDGFRDPLPVITLYYNRPRSATDDMNSIHVQANIENAERDRLRELVAKYGVPACTTTGQ